MSDDSVEILFQSFLREAFMSSSSMARDIHSFDVARPAFPLPTTASPALLGALKDGFREAVVACDMAEPKGSIGMVVDSDAILTGSSLTATS